MLKLKSKTQAIQAFRKLASLSGNPKHSLQGVSAKIFLLMGIQMIKMGRTWNGSLIVGMVAEKVGLGHIYQDLINFACNENSLAEEIVMSYI